LDYVAAFHTNLIFLEIYFSKESGLDLASRIKAAYHDAIMDFLASYDSPENQKAAEQWGVEHVVPKDE
jgi:DNA-binding NarL/FixJ family response regulator